LTKTDQTPKLGRFALLALVKWIKKYKDRSECIETNGVGTSSSAMSLTCNQHTGTNSLEKAKSNNNAGSDNK